jgi:nicotinamidase-related amidase
MGSEKQAHFAILKIEVFMDYNFVPGKQVEVPELNFKDSVILESKKTALIIVDLQNDFVKEGGNLVVPSAMATVQNIKSLLEEARQNGIHIAFTQDTMFKGDLEFDIWPEHCVINTPGWEIIEELKPGDNELVCQKNRYDGFYGTMLEHYLSRVWKVENVIIVGTVANICVLHTAASAGLRWFKVILPADGISALTEFDQAMTLRQVSWLYSGDIVKNCSAISFK